MQSINLKKIILPGTWRYLGLRCPNIPPSMTPIAGREPEEIAKALQGDLYRIGRYDIRNAFVVVKGSARFLYVRPNYSGYRNVARKVFSGVSWDVDYDHALSRRIANQAKPAYEYVLLLRVPPSVNRQHGHFEKKDKLTNPVPPVCFADDRVFDKWLGRPPLSRKRSPKILLGYSPKNATSYGLTLKQRGRWAYAIGMGDIDLPMNHLIKI
ncbi:hypothetical protein AB6H46_22550 [Vibrio alginolyticus]|uniref:hypothetical protein n=1 Tax=Vibrio harveyi group TaxID=717610 RepID=UPI0003A12F08|nr:hypothetical protein [Vibrio jasicida]